MKITKTRQIERKIVELYKISNNLVETTEVLKAKRKIRGIIIFFQLLSMFTEENHSIIIQQLYFSKDNIMEKSIRETAKAVFMPERTLRVYREKYCKIIDEILSWNEEFP